jgi:hypothetical protein
MTEQLKNRILTGLLFMIFLFIIAGISSYFRLQHQESVISLLREDNNIKKQEIAILKKGVYLLSDERDKLTEDKKELRNKNKQLTTNLASEKKKLKDITNKYNEMSADTLEEIIIFAYRYDTGDTLDTHEEIILPKPVVIWALQKNDSLQIYKRIENSMIAIINNQEKIIKNDSLIINNLEETIALKDQIIEKQDEIISNKDNEISQHESIRKKENRKHNGQKLGLIGIIAGILLLL